MQCDTIDHCGVFVKVRSKKVSFGPAKEMIWKRLSDAEALIQSLITGCWPVVADGIIMSVQFESGVH